jgi:hypothetical protein
MDRRRIELGAMLLFPLFACIIAFAFHPNGLLSIFLFYGIPTAYLSFAYPFYVRKAAVFALVSGIPFMSVISYFAHRTDTWRIDSLFPQLLTHIIIEDVIWAVFWIYLTILFYEVFIHHRIEHAFWHPHMKYFAILAFAVVSLFALAITQFSSLLDIPYFYLWMGIIVMLLPVCFEYATHKRVFMTFLGTAVYFFYFHLVYEVTGLLLGWWFFPQSDDFVGMVTLFGVAFPFEELFFWIMLGGIVVLSYFELFDDAQRA